MPSGLFVSQYHHFSPVIYFIAVTPSLSLSLFPSLPPRALLRSSSPLSRPDERIPAVPRASHPRHALPRGAVLFFLVPLLSLPLQPHSWPTSLAFSRLLRLSPSPALCFSIKKESNTVFLIYKEQRRRRRQRGPMEYFCALARAAGREKERGENGAEERKLK